MVFIPALTTFVISNMLGGGKINLIGNIIEQEFTINSNWYLGSGLSLVMMVFIILSMLLLRKFDKTGGENLI
jgi:spermidine/putrescine transport system permease protein